MSPFALLSPRLGRFVAILALAAAPAVLADEVPDDLSLTRFSGPEVTPSPACLCTDAEGHVFVGVDLNGSLGKGPGKGRIVRLVDEDRDGEADSHTVYAEIDNPRGLIAAGDRLWVLHTHFGKGGKPTGMNLVRLTDADRDGVADGPPEILIEGICSASSLESRGTDHSTNGIQLGIDGWIYIAVGDFGFADAVDREGNELTLLGGGIVRVRPDGTEMELYTTGMRNIYDVAIDPFMNVFTRGNTNDGGGWNVRFTHHIQSGEYGYPRLFVNFADEIIPALADLGGGSGVGALFLDDPRWPDAYDGQLLMADWGRKAVYLHRITPDGPTFRQEEEEFVRVSQVSDLDIDPAGQLFLSAWDGAGFKGNPEKGYVVRVVPKEWSHQPAPDFRKLEWDELVDRLASDSGRTRLLAQQALLRRDDPALALGGLRGTFENEELPLEARVAAFYTWAQIEDDPGRILAVAADEALREFALRAATDRLPRLEGEDLPLEPFVSALHGDSPRVRAAAAIALGRLGNGEAADALLAVDYEKPEPEGEAWVTQLDTIKGGRVAEPELAVDPGEKVYLEFAETNAVEEASHLAFLDPEFVLADGATVSLGDLEPVSGEVAVDAAPDGSELKPHEKHSARATLVAEVPATLVYEAPANAVKFRSRVVRSTSGPRGASVDFFASTVPPGEADEGGTVAPRHATPNPEVILPHLAVQSLVRLEADEACVDALGTSSEDLALWALSYLHTDTAVDGILAALENAQGERRRHLLTTLARLHHREAPYDGSWWWTTRPDTRGPYYEPVEWNASPRIAEALTGELEGAGGETETFLAKLNDRMRLGIEALGTREAGSEAETVATVDLEKIRSKKGAVGSTPIEDVLLSLDEIEGDAAAGKQIFTRQGCVACHALENSGPSLGPFMGQIGSIMDRQQIATAIVRPNDTISQGFQTARLKTDDGQVHVGFVTESNTDEIVLRDMTGKVTRVDAKTVTDEQHLPTSMMPPGLANALSLEEFASLVAFLEAQKG